MRRGTPRNLASMTSTRSTCIVAPSPHGRPDLLRARPHSSRPHSSARSPVPTSSVVTAPCQHLLDEAREPRVGVDRPSQVAASSSSISTRHHPECVSVSTFRGTRLAHTRETASVGSRRVLSVELPPEPDQRHPGAPIWRGTSLRVVCSPEVLDTVALLVTELVTNAILHAGTPLQLESSTPSPHHIRLCVEDTSPRTPEGPPLRHPTRSPVAASRSSSSSRPRGASIGRRPARSSGARSRSDRRPSSSSYGSSARRSCSCNGRPAPPRGDPPRVPAHRVRRRRRARPFGCSR